MSSEARRVSLRKFLSSDSARKSLFSLAAAVAVAASATVSSPAAAAVPETPAEGKESQKPSKIEGSLVPTWRDLLDLGQAPGLQEALLLLDAAKAIHDADLVLSSATAKKTMEMAIVTRGLEPVRGLPLLIDPKTRELYGVPDSIWSDQGLPGELVPLGSLLEPAFDFSVVLDPSPSGGIMWARAPAGRLPARRGRSGQV